MLFTRDKNLNLFCRWMNTLTILNCSCISYLESQRRGSGAYDRHSCVGRSPKEGPKGVTSWGDTVDRDTWEGQRGSRGEETKLL